jgi:hypothetical protein
MPCNTRSACLIVFTCPVTFNHVDRSSHLLGKDMERGEMPRAARWPLSITLALFVALLGVAGLWSQFTSR